jgi:hypothetical protein
MPLRTALTPNRRPEGTRPIAMGEGGTLPRGTSGMTMIDAVLLGTGGMMPLPERWLSSVLVRVNGR